MTTATRLAQGDVIEAAALPAADLRALAWARSCFSMSFETFSGMAVGSRVLTAQASFRICTTL